MRIALTGGIACGKSTAAAFFARQGYPVISTDSLAHEILDSPDVGVRLRERFGAGIFLPGGAIDRSQLGRLVFADAVVRAWLEELVHPEVHRRWQAEADAQPGRAWVVEIPVLFEKKLETLFDFSVCVACAPCTQLDRLALRGLDDGQVQDRLRAQFSIEEKMRRADVCLFNEGSVVFLEQQIFALLRDLPKNPV
ncbi:MAG: dephospho-CoA kinase [Puniceicoccales bacterium]|jgi:dephospho-CoA kinase|nr:dephospho-CoA kinase [Puniceicoccales bacterium]